MEENDVKTRLRVALEACNENPTSLARKYGVNQKTLNNQINSDTMISLSTILLISDALPNISLEWLLRGEGDMLKKELSASEQIASMPEERQLEMMDKMERLIGKLSDFTKLKEIYEENNRCLSELIAIEKRRK